MGLDYAKMKTLRQKIGLSQEDAAQAAKLGSKQAWYNIESGRQPNVTIDVLERMADALGVKAKDLLK